MLLVATSLVFESPEAVSRYVSECRIISDITTLVLSASTTLLMSACFSTPYCAEFKASRHSQVWGFARVLVPQVESKWGTYFLSHLPKTG